MGFFNKILKGLGFEDEEVVEPKKINRKEKKSKDSSKVTATYNLNEIEEDKKIENIAISVEKKEEQKDEINSDFEHIKVLSQSEIQSVILKLKNGAKILINLEKLSDNDIIRSLDFLTGAVFALNLKMQKIDEKLYLIQ